MQTVYRIENKFTKEGPYTCGNPYMPHKKHLHNPHDLPTARSLINFYWHDDYICAFVSQEALCYWFDKRARKYHKRRRFTIRKYLVYDHNIKGKDKWQCVIKARCCLMEV